MNARAVLPGLAALAIASCSGGASTSHDAGAGAPPDGSTPVADAGALRLTLTIKLGRANVAGGIRATVQLRDESGAPAAGAPPTIEVQGGTASPVAPGADGLFTAVITPASPDSEVVITARAGNASARKTALAFSWVDPTWDQPEAVEGLVNTTGWEDGVAISPDGQWLIVSSYLPIDAFTCVSQGFTDAVASCKAITGPISAPERPQMLGAERVHGETFDSVCPNLGVTQSIGYPFPPTAAYGFRRQPDGSFAEPFVIGFDADGCLGPYGFFFASAPEGDLAPVVFAHDELQDSPDMHADIAYTVLALGKKNVLGTYRLSNGRPVLTGKAYTRVSPILETRQGNPAYGAGALWWDDEDLPPHDQRLYFAPVTGALPSLTAGPMRTVALDVPGRQDFQPSIDGQDLYWSTADGLVVATLAPGSDPAAPTSWSEPTRILAVSSLAQPILAVGEPNVAHVDGVTELYFVYLRRAGTGFDANVGKVRHR